MKYARGTEVAYLRWIKEENDGVATVESETDL
jgi:hypothetical protein